MAKNLLQPGATPLQGQQTAIQAAQSQNLANLPSVRRNLSNYISPAQLYRIKQDVRLWREAVAEAEFAYYPQRIKQQRLYIDTELNGHVTSCVDRRMGLTMLRDFELCNKSDKEIPDITEMFKADWFDNFVCHSLGAEYYAYSLIALGDIKDEAFPDLDIVKRWNVSPDRHNVTSFVYSTNGKDFRDPDVADWHVYVKTLNPHGTSPCGYGLFYKIGIYEITLRNVLGFNGDFVERYSMPYIWAKTNKTNEDERGELEMDLRNAGANGYFITDPNDDISFLEAALAGTGWNGYDNLEQRCEKKISKMILGHADAMDSTPGKLGPEQGGEESPISAALSAKQSQDGRKIERIVNNDLIPRMIRLGFKLPSDIKFKYKNDDEAQDQRWNEDKNNNATATVAQVMKNAGMQMDPQYFTERTGIPFTPIVPPAPIMPGVDPNKKDPAGKSPIPEKIKNKLAKLYK